MEDLNPNTLELIIMIAAPIITAVLGYLKTNPKYIKVKKSLKAVSDAIEDDKTTATELKDVVDIFVNKGSDKAGHEIAAKHK